MRAAVILLSVALLVLAITVFLSKRNGAQKSTEIELASLRNANAILQQRLATYEEADRRRQARRLVRAEAAQARKDATPSAPLSNSSAATLDIHRKWDWRSIVDDFLRPWPSIGRAQLDAAVASCNGSAMYCQRFQVHNGKLFVTDYAAIFFDRHYAPARVMPLLDTLRRHPDLPNLDIVVAGNDEPRVHNMPGDERLWRRMCDRHCAASATPPALFSSTTNRATFDLPWLDFAWFFPRRPHKLRTPPWSVLHPQLFAAGGRVAWHSKVELAMHTGNVGSWHRKRLAAVAQRSPDTVLVNELFIGDHSKIHSTCEQLGLHRQGGYQQHKCYMTFEDQCRYKYLLNSASIGYANKFKSLLLCGSVVLYVRDGMRHKEFYEYGLLSGVHYVTVDTAEDVPAMVRWLRQNDAYARAVGEAGRARMSSLDAAGLGEFMAELLRQYARRLSFRALPQPGAVHMECEDDLFRHYALSRPWLDAYLMRDNATCVHPPQPGARLGPPGWGGSYRGSKPRCYASHDRSPAAQPHACDFDRPYSTSESFEVDGVFPKAHPKSGDGWDMW